MDLPSNTVRPGCLLRKFWRSPPATGRHAVSAARASKRGNTRRDAGIVLRLVGGTGYRWSSDCRPPQIRVSDDYVPNIIGSQKNWNIGASSILAHSLGLVPFKDSFWSTKFQKGSSQRFGAHEPTPAREAAVSTLTAGPVTPSCVLAAVKGHAGPREERRIQFNRRCAPWQGRRRLFGRCAHPAQLPLRRAPAAAFAPRRDPRRGLSAPCPGRRSGWARRRGLDHLHRPRRRWVGGGLPGCATG